LRTTVLKFGTRPRKRPLPKVPVWPVYTNE
jgi:hypothetical protein